MRALPKVFTALFLICWTHFVQSTFPGPEFLSIPRENLKRRIIEQLDATAVEETPYFKAQKYVHENRISLGTSSPEDFDLPQILIRKREPDSSSIARNPNLKRSNGAFFHINNLLASIRENHEELASPLQEAYKAYESFLAKLISSSLEERIDLLQCPSKLTFEDGETFHILPEQAYRVRGRDKYGHTSDERIGGSHSVIIKDEIYYKSTIGARTPVNTLNEKAIYNFYGLFQGDNTLSATSISFDISKIPVARASGEDPYDSEKILASQEVIGTSLDQHEGELDQYTYQAHAFLSILTQSIDCHEGNFIVTAEGKLVSIDNDMAFEKIYRPDGALNLTNALLWRDEWDAVLDDDLRKKIQEIDVEILTCRWLSLLQKRIDEEWKFKLPKAFLEELPRKIKQAQLLLSGGQALKFKDVVKAMDPLLFLIIEKARGDRERYSLKQSERFLKLTLLLKNDKLDIGEIGSCNFQSVLKLMEEYSQVDYGLLSEKYEIMLGSQPLFWQRLIDNLADLKEGKDYFSFDNFRSDLRLWGLPDRSSEISNALFRRIKKTQDIAFAELMQMLPLEQIYLDDEETFISDYKDLLLNETLGPFLSDLEEKNRKLKFYRMIASMLPSLARQEEEQPYLMGSQSGKRDIPESIYKQLFDDKGDFIARNKILSGVRQGRRNVGYADWKDYRLYFKLLPELPGLEKQVGELSYLLFRRGTPQTELFRVVGGKYNGYPILVSEGIKGRTLREAEGGRFGALNYDQFGELFFLTLLTNPEDGNRGNYVLTPEDNIIAIDNDRSFVPAIARKKVDSSGFKIQVKTVIYCLDYMNTPLSRNVLEDILRLDVQSLLMRWLNTMKSIGDGYISLYQDPPERLRILKDHQVMIDMPYPKGAILDLYNKFMRIKDVIQEAKEVADWELTAIQLLEEIQPQVGRRYKKAFTYNIPLKERFLRVEGDQFGPNGDNTLSNTYQTLLSQNIFFSEDIFDKVKQERRGVSQAQEELVKAINDEKQFALKGSRLEESVEFIQSASAHFVEKFLKGAKLDKLTDAEQRKLLQAIKKRRGLKYVNLDGLRILLSDSGFRDYDHLKEINTLSLSGSGNLTSRFITFLQEEHERLKDRGDLIGLALGKLNLSNSPSLDFFYYKGMLWRTKPAELEFLTHLSLVGCPKLQKIDLAAPCLRSLSASENPILESIILQASSLEKISARQCQKLNGNIIIKRSEYQEESSPKVRLDVSKNDWFTDEIIDETVKKLETSCMGIDADYLRALYLDETLEKIDGQSKVLVHGVLAANFNIFDNILLRRSSRARLSNGVDFFRSNIVDQEILFTIMAHGSRFMDFSRVYYKDECAILFFFDLLNPKSSEEIFFRVINHKTWLFRKHLPKILLGVGKYEQQGDLTGIMKFKKDAGIDDLHTIIQPWAMHQPHETYIKSKLVYLICRDLEKAALLDGPRVECVSLGAI